MEVRFSMGLEIFLFNTMSRPALGFTQPPIQWVRGVLSLVIKWPGCEADHSPPSSAEVKECVPFSQYVFMAWCFVKHRDNFTFTVTVNLPFCQNIIYVKAHEVRRLSCTCFQASVIVLGERLVSWFVYCPQGKIEYGLITFLTVVMK
jgi:hypothetical protein